MSKLFIIYAVLAVYIDESVLNVDAQTAGTAKAPFSSATATTTYANNDNCYGPKFAIDGYSDSSGCNFFHSKATVPYPYLAAVMDGSSQVSSVTLKSRCDANGWGHTQFTVEVQVGTGAPCLAPILGTGSARLSGIANQVTCGTYTGTVAQCSTVEIKCAATTTTAPTCLTVQLWTNGASNVHLMFEDVTVSATSSATAISSSVYYNRYGDFSAYWGPAFAIDSAQSSTWYGMFHSAYETYPWMQIALPAAATVTTVTLRSRCDANAWSCSVPNSITVEVRVGTSAIATAGQKGQLTGGQTCGLKTGCDASACTTHTITCAPALASATHITVQMLDATNTFLMLDEVTWA